MRDVDVMVKLSNRMVAGSRELLASLDSSSVMAQVEESMRLIEESEQYLHRIRLIQQHPWWKPKR